MLTYTTHTEKQDVNIPEIILCNELLSEQRIEKQSFSIYENASGLWELFNYIEDCSALLFHPRSHYSQCFQINRISNASILWASVGCKFTIISETKNFHSFSNDTLLLSETKNESLTLKIEASAGAGFLVMQLPNNILNFTKGSDSNIECSSSYFQPIGKEHPATPLVNEIFYKKCRPELRKHIVFGKIYEVINSILLHRNLDSREHYDDSTCNHEQLTLTKKAETILHKHYAAPPSLDQLAKRVGTNRNKLSQSFKAVHGKTVFEYCTQYRMTMAKRMLSKHTLSIAHVAELVGYEYPGNFTSAYKRHFGELPKSTRRLGHA